MPIPIRAQLNHTKKNWQVAKRTPAGAWEVISNMTHNSQEEAEAMVDWYLDGYPDKYVRYETKNK